MAEKLEGAQFRWLNEAMYSADGAETQGRFARDAGAFDVYHKGFRKQAAKWPQNPLHVFIRWVQGRADGVRANGQFVRPLSVGVTCLGSKRYSPVSSSKSVQASDQRSADGPYPAPSTTCRRAPRLRTNLLHPLAGWPVSHVTSSSDG